MSCGLVFAWSDFFNLFFKFLRNTRLEYTQKPAPDLLKNLKGQLWVEPKMLW